MALETRILLQAIWDMLRSSNDIEEARRRFKQIASSNDITLAEDDKE